MWKRAIIGAAVLFTFMIAWQIAVIGKLENPMLDLLVVGAWFLIWLALQGALMLILRLFRH